MADIIHRAPAEHEAPLSKDLQTPKTEAVQAYEDLVAQQKPPSTAKEKQEQEKAREKAKPSADELRAALNARTEQISRRVGAIQDEVSQVPAEVRKAIKHNPLVSLGGSLAGGLLVGLLIGGIGRRKSLVPAAHESLVAEYLDALADDVKHAVKRGEEVGQAIKRTIGKHTPLVIVAGGDDPASPKNVLRSGFDMAVKTALGFGVKMALDRAMVASGFVEAEPTRVPDPGGTDALDVVGAPTEM